MIRLKVFIPVFLTICLLGFVAIYCIDAWLTRWIENGISSITDTKTDITSLNLSFKNSSLRIKRLEIASQEDEWKNAVEFEDIIVDFQSLPLLHKRFVVDEFSIKGVGWGARRTHSGKLPPRKKAPPSWLSEKMGEAMGSLKKEAAELPVSKLFDFEIPSDPGEIVNSLNLKSVEAFKASMSTTQEFRSRWATRIEELRDVGEYEKRIAEARKLAQNPPRNPEEILQTVETIKKTYEFFEGERRRAESLLGDVSSDLRKIQKEFDSAKEALESDYERAKKTLSLDELKVSNLSRMLFGPVWIDRAETVLRYHSLLRKSLASMSSKDESVEVKKRAKGRDIIFVHEKKEPSFVLAKSEFSAAGIDNGDRKLISQLYQLKLKDINSNPKTYGKPSHIEFKAEFKDSMVGEVLFKAFLDYTKEIDKDEFSLAVDKMKADAWPVGIPKFFPVKLVGGMAKAETKLHSEGEAIKWVSQISFKDVAWDFSEVPKNGIIEPILQDVFSNVKSFNLELELLFGGKGLDFNVRSDLDSLLKAGINAAVQKKVAEFQEKLHQEIEKRVAVYKEQATKQLNEFQTDSQKKVEGLVQKVTAYGQEANQLQDSLKKKAQEAAAGKVQQEIQKAIPGLSNPLKGFKKPF